MYSNNRKKDTVKNKDFLPPRHHHDLSSNLQSDSANSKSHKKKRNVFH